MTYTNRSLMTNKKNHVEKNQQILMQMLPDWIKDQSEEEKSKYVTTTTVGRYMDVQYPRDLVKTMVPYYKKRDITEEEMDDYFRLLSENNKLCKLSESAVTISFSASMLLGETTDAEITDLLDEPTKCTETYKQKFDKFFNLYTDLLLNPTIEGLNSVEGGKEEKVMTTRILKVLPRLTLATFEEMQITESQLDTLVAINNHPVVQKLLFIAKDMMAEEGKVIPEVMDKNFIEWVHSDKNITMPEFPGGQEACMRFLAENINYPSVCIEQGIQGRVNCQFVVTETGEVTDIVVGASPNDYLSKEAVRVLSLMPKWKPGTLGGRPVRVKHHLPVLFRFKETPKQSGSIPFSIPR